MTLTLYAYTSRSRAERVAWVLQELELEHQIIRLNYKTFKDPNSADFCKLHQVNPALKVPVLVHHINDQDFVLTESLAICLYLCRLKSSLLIPSDPIKEAMLHERILFCVSEIEANLWTLDQALHIKRFDLTPETVDYLIKVIQKNTQVVEGWIQDYALDDHFTLLDILCYHILTWTSMYGVAISSKTKEYLERLEARKSFPILMKAAGSPATAK